MEVGRQVGRKVGRYLFTYLPLNCNSQFNNLAAFRFRPQPQNFHQTVAQSQPSAFRLHAPFPVITTRVFSVMLQFNFFGTERTNSKPQTGNPQTETRKTKAREPKPANRNPQTETRKSKPVNRNPQIETRNPNPCRQLFGRLAGRRRHGRGSHW